MAVAGVRYRPRAVDGDNVPDNNAHVLLVYRYVVALAVRFSIFALVASGWHSQA